MYFFKFYEEDEDGQGEDGEAGGIHYEWAGPYLFVDGEYHVPGEASEDHDAAHYKEVGEHFISLAFLLNIIANEVAEDYLYDRGKGAGEAFGIEGYAFAFVHVCFAEYAFIYGDAEIAFQAEWIYGILVYAQGPIAEQKDGTGKEGAAYFKEVNDERGKAIAEGYALEYAEYANAGGVFAGLYGIHPGPEGEYIVAPPDERRPVEEEADGEYEKGAGEYFLTKYRSASCFEARHNKGEGVAYCKQEEGEYEIGWRASMPGRMFKWCVDISPATGIVHEDHEGNGSPAKYIEGIEALGQSSWF